MGKVWCSALLAAGLLAQDRAPSLSGRELPELIRRGDVAELEKIAAGKDPHAAWIATIALEEIRAKTYEPAPRVSLRFDGAPLADVVKALEDQTGRKLHVAPEDRLRKTSIDVKQVAYAEAVWNLARAAELDILWKDGPALGISSDKLYSAPAYSYEDFVIILDGVELCQHNRFNEFSCTISILMEVASLHPFRAIEVRKVKLLKALAEDGAGMQADCERWDDRFNPFGDDPWMRFGLKAQYRKKVTKLALLRGCGEIVLARTEDSIEIKGPFRHKEEIKVEKDNVRAHIYDVQINDETIELSLELTGLSDELLEFADPRRTLRVFDRDGKEYDTEKVIAWAGKNTVGLSFDAKCGEMAEPEKIVVKFPREIAVRKFFFEFKDVDLR